MYNEDLKLKFLETIASETTQRSYRTFFSKWELDEQRAGIDLGFFSYDDTVHVINQSDCIAMDVARTYINNVNRYQSYCNPSRGFNLKPSDYDFVAAIKRTLFANEADFLTELQRHCPFDQLYALVPALCMAWVGIDIKTACEIPEDGFDYAAGTIRNSAGNIVARNISEPICEVLRTYNTTPYGWRTQNRTFKVTPMPNGRFLRQVKTQNSHKKLRPLKSSDITNDVTELRARIYNATGSNRMTYTNVYKSGQLSRLYQLEQSGIDVASPQHRDQIQRDIFNGTYNIFDNLAYYRKYKEAFQLA